VIFIRYMIIETCLSTESVI